MVIQTATTLEPVYLAESGQAGAQRNIISLSATIKGTNLVFTSNHDRDCPMGQGNVHDDGKADMRRRNDSETCPTMSEENVGAHWASRGQPPLCGLQSSFNGDNHHLSETQHRVSCCFSKRGKERASICTNSTALCLIRVAIVRILKPAD